MNRFLIFIFCALFSTSLFAESKVSAITVLGDDYSDLGNLTNVSLTGTSENWISLLGEKFGISVTGTQHGGTDFANVQALTGVNVNPSAPISLLDQLADNPFGASHISPIAIYGGINDMIYQNSVPLNTTQTAINLLQMVKSFHGHDYKTVILLNLFDLGKSPVAGQGGLPSADTLTSQTLAINQGIAERLSDSAPIILIDLYSLFNQVLAEPAVYGFTNVTDFAPSPINFEGYLFYFPFFDAPPWTVQFHQILADFVFATLQGAQSYAALAEQPLTLMRNQLFDLQQQMYPLQPPGEIGKFRPFFGIDYSAQAQPAIANAWSHYRSTSEKVIAGLMNRVISSVNVGGAVAFHRARMNMEQSNFSGHFTTLADMVSLFADWFDSPGYLQGVVQASYLQFTKFHRRFATGQAVHHTAGHTHGWSYELQTQGALWALDGGTYQIGPMVSLDYAQVFVHGFDESGKMGTLRYKSQETASMISGLGIEARFQKKMPKFHWVADFSLLASRQWLNNGREIHFQPLSMNEVYGDWPIESVQSWFGSLSSNISGTFSNGQTLSLGWHLNMGPYALRENVLSAGWTY